jgi:hypothetical protein
MQESETGNRILEEKPRICELDLNELRRMSPESLGHSIYAFYEEHGIDNKRFLIWFMCVICELFFKWRFMVLIIIINCKTNNSAFYWFGSCLCASKVQRSAWFRASFSWWSLFDRFGLRSYCEIFWNGALCFTSKWILSKFNFLELHIWSFVRYNAFE